MYLLCNRGTSHTVDCTIQAPIRSATSRREERGTSGDMCLVLVLAIFNEEKGPVVSNNACISCHLSTR